MEISVGDMATSVSAVATVVGAVGTVVATFFAWKVAEKTAEQGREMREAAESDKLQLARERATLAAEGLASKANVAASLISDVRTSATLSYHAKGGYGGSRWKLIDDECEGARKSVEVLAEVASKFQLLEPDERENLTIDDFDSYRLKIESNKIRIEVIIDSMRRRHDYYSAGDNSKSHEKFHN